MAVTGSSTTSSTNWKPTASSTLVRIGRPRRRSRPRSRPRAKYKVPRVPKVPNGLVLGVLVCLIPVVTAQQLADEQMIRAARARSNAAIAAHDLAAIAGEWMPDVHVVS